MKAHTPDLIKDTCRESFSKQFEELESPGKHLRDQIVAMVTLPQNIKVQKKISSLQTSLHDFFAQAPNKASNVGALGPDMRPTRYRTTRANNLTVHRYIHGIFIVRVKDITKSNLPHSLSYIKAI